MVIEIIGSTDAVVAVTYGGVDLVRISPTVWVM